MHSDSCVPRVLEDNSRVFFEISQGTKENTRAIVNLAVGCTVAGRTSDLRGHGGVLSKSPGLLGMSLRPIDLARGGSLGIPDTDPRPLADGYRDNHLSGKGMERMYILALITYS